MYNSGKSTYLITTVPRAAFPEKVVYLRPEARVSFEENLNTTISYLTSRQSTIIIMMGGCIPSISLTI